MNLMPLSTLMTSDPVRMLSGCAADTRLFHQSHGKGLANLSF